MAKSTKLKLIAGLATTLALTNSTLSIEPPVFPSKERIKSLPSSSSKPTTRRRLIKLARKQNVQRLITNKR